MFELLWRPSVARVKTSSMTDFTRYLSKRQSRAFADYSELHEWTIQHLDEFWSNYLDYTRLLYSSPATEVLSHQQMPGARWFTGMHLNYAENILSRHFTGLALLACTEQSSGKGENIYEKYTFDELKSLVSRCARGLRRHGIKNGDHVAGYVANVAEAVIACLACASLGAVWSSASPDFGLDALADRLQQVQPRLLFVNTHYRYGGKVYRLDKIVGSIKTRIPSVEKIVAIPYSSGNVPVCGDVTWIDFLGENDNPELEFEQVPFEHPLFILFSSGTTGKPKCIVHSTGGTLLQHRKELQLHSNLKEKDRLLFFTTCGWMMWNWQLSALSLGATICLYDGNPGYPDLSAIWHVVDDYRITHFGTSGRFLETCMKHQPIYSLGELGSFTTLESLLYTGSPLSESGYRWVYKTIKKDLHLAGISGGTDIISCFVLGNPNLPVYAGEIQCKGLGVDVAAFDASAQAVLGEPGELVCRKPIPSMPIYFLNDPDGKKYYGAYFDVYPGIWRHGDYIEFTQNGGCIIYGRSDATLNPGGVRIGSAEIYSALDHLDYITGAVVTGWQVPGDADESIVLFVVLNKHSNLDGDMKNEIKTTIREKLSPRHVPKFIFQISEVPVTRSGKPVELSVKAVLAGKTVHNRTALANPHVLEEIEQIRKTLLG